LKYHSLELGFSDFRKLQFYNKNVDLVASEVLTAKNKEFKSSSSEKTYCRFTKRACL